MTNTQSSDAARLFPGAAGPTAPAAPAAPAGPAVSTFSKPPKDPESSAAQKVAPQHNPNPATTPIPQRPSESRPSWWQRRLIQPIRQQLTQGITPDRIALTIALGFGLGIFPILGSGFILCALAAWALKLNQPIIQATGTLAYPLQLVLLLPYYRAGEALFQLPPAPLSIPVLIQRFFENIPLFLQEYGMTGLRGILVWTLTAPLATVALWFSLRPLLRTAASTSAARRALPTSHSSSQTAPVPAAPVPAAPVPAAPVPAAPAPATPGPATAAACGRIPKIPDP